LKEPEVDQFYEDSDDLGESSKPPPKILAKKPLQKEFTPSKNNPLAKALEKFPSSMKENPEARELTFSPNDSKESQGSSK